MNTRQKRKEGATLEDNEIIGLYFERDDRAIGETDMKYGNYLYTVAHNVLSSHEDSEECLNDTYVKTWNAIPPTVPRVLRAFLARITRNLALDRYDREKRQISVQQGSADTLSDYDGFIPERCYVEDEAGAREIGRIISEYLDSVNDKKLYIFVSRYYYAAPIDAIASRMGMSRSSVFKCLASMRQELRERLAKGGIQV